MFTRINLSYDSRTMIEKKGINLRDCRSVDLIDCFTIDTLLMYAIYIYISNVIFADFIYRESESER